MSLTQGSLIFVAIVSISLTDIPDRGELCVNDNIYFFFFSLGGGYVLGSSTFLAQVLARLDYQLLLGKEPALLPVDRTWESDRNLA